MPQFEEKVRTMYRSGEFFDREHPVYIGRAPGRMDLMGGNVDYTGGWVFESGVTGKKPGDAPFSAIKAHIFGNLPTVGKSAEAPKSLPPKNI